MALVRGNRLDHIIIEEKKSQQTLLEPCFVNLVYYEKVWVVFQPPSFLLHCSGGLGGPLGP